MKEKRTIGLLIILVLVAGGAFYYFSTQENTAEDSDLSVNMFGAPMYIHSENPSVTLNTSDLSPSITTFDGEYVDGTTPLSTTQEEIVQSIFLAEQNNLTYSLFVKEFLERSLHAPWMITTDYNFADHVDEATPQFFITDTSTVKTDDRFEIIRTYKNTHSGTVYVKQMAFFWIIDDLVTPEKAIAALITSADPAILASGACQVEKIQDETYTRESALLHQYQIIFNIEKLDTALLQKISGKSLAGICGKYGPVQSPWGTTTGTFIFDQGVLIYLDGQNTLWSPYNFIRVLKTLN